MEVVKVDKERAMLRYRRLRRAAALSRCLLEALAALSLLSWSSARLPAALALCTGLRHLPALLLHPLSAFLVGNAIIVALVAKSSEASAAAADPHPQPSLSSAAKPAPSSVYDHHDSAATPPRRCNQEEYEGGYVLYEDKAMCLEGATTAAAAGSAAGYTTTTGSKKGRPEGRSFHRTRSGEIPGRATEKGSQEKLLRRSQSAAAAGAGGKVVAKWWEEDKEEEEEVTDDGDSEEFRQKVEAFIARQLRFIETEEESLLLAAKAASTGTGADASKIAAGGRNHNGR